MGYKKKDGSLYDVAELPGDRCLKVVLDMPV